VVSRPLRILINEINLGPGHVVLDKVAAPTLKGAQPPFSPQFSAHVYCGQTAGWMKTPRRTDVDLSPGHIVLDRDPAPTRERGTAAAAVCNPCLLVAYLSYC